uniref:uncharacterized protein LOC122605857 n=1 Tax=Erigeron canadensis TaxID=72917 RepID=UPI001CB8CEA8|nr:uncharacterized protein LOC122605857 [Erigeron canadensis]
MATLQKFKMLATQCAVAGSPTRSPSTSPVIHLRRRKTLRMLLTRGGGGGSRRLEAATEEFVDRRGNDVDSSEDDDDDEKDNGARRKLKDLFVSSPSPPQEDHDGDGCDEMNLIGRCGGGGGGGGGRGIRCLLRQRLLRRAWRPVLVTIPE